MILTAFYLTNFINEGTSGCNLCLEGKCKMAFLPSAKKYHIFPYSLKIIFMSVTPDLELMFGSYMFPVAQNISLIFCSFLKIKLFIPNTAGTVSGLKTL